MVKGQGQAAGLCPNVVCSIFLDPFDGKLPNLIQWMPLEIRCSGHMVKGQMADV